MSWEAATRWLLLSEGFEAQHLKEADFHFRPQQVAWKNKSVSHLNTLQQLQNIQLHVVYTEQAQDETKAQHDQMICLKVAEQIQ